ncbi:toxic anion resistance protein [Asticcacaulis sp. AC466]|uniref:toxic anion resistance protein n=1 Tax=Asticcacaulis sp. AC466 TaxID=1282362 RepID=UPI0003FC7D66|nr:toxic anion resistance protein [Asticcacaulis sp. AC466]
MSETKTAVTGSDAVMDVQSVPTGNLPATVKVVLPPEKRTLAEELARKTPLVKTADHTVVTFGQEAIASFGAKLDDILSEITKADSPVLFELFRTIKDGVNGADLGELEQTIRKKLQYGFLERVLMALGLSDPANRLKRVTDEVRGMLQSKAKSLSDLIKPMEKQIESETTKLIGEVSRMSTLADGYRDNIESLGVYVEAGRHILTMAETELVNQTELAKSGDPLKVQQARDFAQKVDLFRNRVLVLESSYAKAPTDLDSIGLVRGAALATLADTVTSAHAEFNDVKSILIRLHALFQTQSVQQMNLMRRELRASLQGYGLDVLESVSVDAVKASGEARLADADLVLGAAQRLRVIADKVVAEGERNKQRYAAARVKLEQARQLAVDRPIAS